MAIELFKLNESLVPSQSRREAAAALESWRGRTRSGKFFLYYESGKCACRVDTDGLYVPVSVHMCLPRKPDGKWDEQRLATRVWSNDARNATARHVPFVSSAVLHYPAWDPAALWHKYVLHGNFDDKLPSGATHKSGLEWGNCFHVECRDVYIAAQSEDDGGYGAMLDLFRRAVMLPDADEARRQVNLGLLTRVRHAINFLGGAQAAAAFPPLALPNPQPTPQPTPLPTPTPPTPPKPRAKPNPNKQQSAGGSTAANGPPPQPRAALPPAQPRSRGGGGGSTSQEPSPAAEPSPPLTAAEALLQPVWTAGQQRRIEPWQAHGDYAVERLAWRGPKVWRPRLKGAQLEALKMMAGSK